MQELRMSDDPTAFYRERAMSLGECQAALASAERQLAELNDKYLRALAANENARKQAERDAAQQIQQRMSAFARRLLDVADNLERALSHAAQDDPLRAGVQATFQQLQAALSQEGIKPIQVEVGTPFDPHRHEAIGAQPADVEQNTVAAITQAGYAFDGQILRPARVVVAVPRPAETG
jgi:molecular chaperone GrpE